MPRYLCKVDSTYVFEREVIAVDENEATLKAEQLDYQIDPAIRGNIDVWEIEELPETVVPFTYPALPDDAPQDLKDAYAVFEKYLRASIELPGTTENDNLLAEHIKTNKERIRKQSDTTKITKEQYDEILLNYEHYKQGMLLGVNSSQKLTEHLNKLLGLNKSRSVYSKIWCGGVDRESLPKGE